MRITSLRRGLAAFACTAALIGTVGAVGLVAGGASAATTAKGDGSGLTLTSSDGKVVKAPKGLVTGVHNGFMPKGATKDTPRPKPPGSVIGADSRYQYTTTTSFPSRAVVQIKNNGTQQWCTGWMVSPNYLLTAGHCVYNVGPKTWNNNLTFSPGANGSATPYGTCGMVARWSFTNYINSGDPNYDVGIVKLNCSVGYNTGWFGTWWQSASLAGSYSTVQGYPCDKPYGTQWAAGGYIDSSSTADRLRYLTDTYNCESGSPIQQYRSSGAAFCAGYCVMGVHTTGNIGGYNSGVRFTQGKLNAIYALVNQG